VISQPVQLAFGIGGDASATKGNPSVLTEMADIPAFRGIDQVYILPFAKRSANPQTEAIEAADESLYHMGALPGLSTNAQGKLWHLYPNTQVALPRMTKPNPAPPNTPPMPCFIAYIGPPAISPTLFVSRYLTARTDSPYFVESPNSALIHIQTKAPGPPRTMAVATPTILPVPTVAESAVIRDWNGEMSPSCFSFFWKIMPTA
jgi:hypothetical protein